MQRRRRKKRSEKEGTEEFIFEKKRNFVEGEKRKSSLFPSFAMNTPAVALRATSSSARVATVASAAPRPGRQNAQPRPLATPTPSSMVMGRRRRIGLLLRRPPPLSTTTTLSSGGGEHVFGPGTGRLPREELAGPIEILRQASIDLKAAGSSALEAFKRRNDVVVFVDGDDDDDGAAKSSAAQKGSAMGNSKFLPMVML